MLCACECVHVRACVRIPKFQQATRAHRKSPHRHKHLHQPQADWDRVPSHCLRVRVRVRAFVKERNACRGLFSFPPIHPNNIVWLEALTNLKQMNDDGREENKAKGFLQCCCFFFQLVWFDMLRWKETRNRNVCCREDEIWPLAHNQRPACQKISQQIKPQSKSSRSPSAVVQWMATQNW